MSSSLPEGPGQHRPRPVCRGEQGVPALIASHQNPSKKAKDGPRVGKGVGGTRAGGRDHLQGRRLTDLFGEQTVQAAARPALVRLDSKCWLKPATPRDGLL